MPKPHTFPTLYDDLKTVSISFLTKHGYLRPNQWRSGTITWSRNGKKTGSISILVETQPEKSYLQLDYKCNEAPINYRVQLVSAPSNLGKGVVWYFICPSTGKRCRKLYLAETYFYHRSAFKGCLYEKQTQSKKSRYLDKTLGEYFRAEQLYELLYKKHFKKHYAGKPTKRYLKLTQQIKRAESITYQEIESALLS
jgi:hypothetical protein